jgi:hypothetical protein
LTALATGRMSPRQPAKLLPDLTGQRELRDTNDF